MGKPWLIEWLLAFRLWSEVPEIIFNLGLKKKVGHQMMKYTVLQSSTALLPATCLHLFSWFSALIWTRTTTLRARSFYLFDGQCQHLRGYESDSCVLWGRLVDQGERLLRPLALLPKNIVVFSSGRVVVRPQFNSLRYIKHSVIAISTTNTK